MAHDNIRPLKRTDLPPDVLQAVLDQFAREHPDKEIKFAGDVPEEELPPPLLAQMDQMDAEWRDSVRNGTCVECKRRIPMDHWPPHDGEKLPDGWGTFNHAVTGEPIAVICDDCDHTPVGGSKVLVADVDWPMGDSLKNGTCVICEAPCPTKPWPPKSGTPVPEGWQIGTDKSQQPLFIICPKCAKEVGDGSPDQ